MPVSIEKMEKRFLYGTDASPEECLTVGYPAVFLDKDGNRIAVLSFWNCRQALYQFQWEWFNDEDQKSMLSDFLGIDEKELENLAQTYGQDLMELKNSCMEDPVSLLSAMKDMGKIFVMESLESTPTAKEYRHVLEAILYNNHKNVC